MSALLCEAVPVVAGTISLGRPPTHHPTPPQASKCAAYPKKHVLPRLFHTMDTKRDGVLDFEEFLSAVALFRCGSTEEKIKVLFLMYEPSAKTGHLMREQLRQLLVDALMVAQRQDVSLAQTEEWIQDQAELSQGLVEMALAQFASAGSQQQQQPQQQQQQQQLQQSAPDGKGGGGTTAGALDLSEFVAFVSLEGSIQGLLGLLPTVIDL